MRIVTRRGFVSTSSIAATAACAADLGFLASLGHAAASDTRIHPDDVVFSAETERLLRLIRTTTAAEGVAAFAREIKNGLSYRMFLSVLFLAAVENGDPHQVAQVYGAHRIGSDARMEERLLPLFWVLNRIQNEMKGGGAKPSSALTPFKGQLPGADQAAGLFRESMLKSDKAGVERAALAIARDHGVRYAMRQLLEFAPRNVGTNLGHPAIALANSLRALEAMGWQHGEIALRYMADFIGGYEGDGTYAPNLERVKQNLPHLPVDWAGTASDPAATLELYKVLRSGQATESCDLICAQLLSRKVKAGSVWDAISLAASDTLVRYKTGGDAIGGSQIHAITTSNALRHLFNLSWDPETKLTQLLQAAAVTSDFYVRNVEQRGGFRDRNLLDLKASDDKTPGTIRGVFEALPYKARDYNEKDVSERAASDQACQMAFGLLGNEDNQASFMQTARSFLCVKAGMDAHDIKYPAALFEDAELASPQWRPYLLASSVHALHGSRSNDTATLVQVREALK